ncbi:hypothetical protein QEG98_08810 [Myxococcus sp. MxC21-1]|nr:hypothetical protein [Myxococcus sp. MxC21-1]WNZ63781.1 hypothetical protein QEG98_08810 [Myxococcus sp. MxC21-1]
MTGWLDITGVGAPVTVQDAGRPGKMHHGVPPGGPLVPELLALANLAVGNASGTAALEAFGRLELRARGRSVRVSMDGHALTLADGERLTVPAPESTSVRYVAVDGGLAVPEVLGDAAPCWSRAWADTKAACCVRVTACPWVTRTSAPRRERPVRHWMQRRPSA